MLTGETGAGKSIILDALGLALGGRSDRGLVRAGARAGLRRCRVRAAGAGPLRALLDENAIPIDGELILRRLSHRRRAQPCLRQRHAGERRLLRQIGDLLVEVHGQFDQRGLLNPQSHRILLDAFGGLAAPVAAVRAAHARVA